MCLVFDSLVLTNMMKECDFFHFVTFIDEIREKSLVLVYFFIFKKENEAGTGCYSNIIVIKIWWGPLYRDARNDQKLNIFFVWPNAWNTFNTCTVLEIMLSLTRHRINVTKFSNSNANNSYHDLRNLTLKDTLTKCYMHP